MKIYLIRHGKTMFNTIGRAQGWSDTPLTKEGQAGITAVGLGIASKGIKFDRAYSSDSGRTIQTMNLILKHSDNDGIPYKMDWRIREWCFGSFDGGYDGDLFEGVLPRIFAETNADRKPKSTAEIARAIYEVDTAGWAETWEELSGRIIDGFSEMAKEAEEAGAENVVIVSHGMTISTFVELIRPEEGRPHGLENGSVTELDYQAGKFTVKEVGSLVYRHLGREIMEDKRKLAL
jgi:probable phosphoglycerate mutase